MSSKARLLPSEDSLAVLVCEQSDGGTSVHGPFSSAKNFCVALQAMIVGALGGAVPSIVNVRAPTEAPSGSSKLNAATACDVAGAPLIGSAGADPLPFEPCTNRSPAGTSGGAGGVGAPLPTLAALHQAAMSGACAFAGATSSATTAALPTAASATAAVRRERRDCGRFIVPPPSWCACAASPRRGDRSPPRPCRGTTRSPARRSALPAACLRQ